jgi:hypothetical protein
LRELEFLPPWYPLLRQTRRTLTLRLWLSAGAAVLLALVAAGARCEGGSMQNAIAAGGAAAASVAAVAIWWPTRRKLARLSVTSMAASMAATASDSARPLPARKTPALSMRRLAAIAKSAGVHQLERFPATGSAAPAVEQSARVAFKSDLASLAAILAGLSRHGQSAAVRSLSVVAGDSATSFRIEMVLDSPLA